MREENEKGLKQQILQNMVTNHKDALKRHYERAIKWISLTKTGKVVIIAKGNLTAKQKVLLYLLGKLYAAEAELCEDPFVANEEFLEELGMPKGTLLPVLKRLRDGNVIKRTKQNGKVKHYLAKNRIESFLDELEESLNSD